MAVTHGTEHQPPAGQAHRPPPTPSPWYTHRHGVLTTIANTGQVPPPVPAVIPAYVTLHAAAELVLNLHRLPTLVAIRHAAGCADGEPLTISAIHAFHMYEQHHRQVGAPPDEDMTVGERVRLLRDAAPPPPKRVPGATLADRPEPADVADVVAAMAVAR